MRALTNLTVAQLLPSHVRLARTQDQPSAVQLRPSGESSPFAYCSRRSIRIGWLRPDRSRRTHGPGGCHVARNACALPNRAVHPDCARTHRHGRDCVASPWTLKRARRHQPLPHPLGACRATHQMVAELHSTLHRPFQESASTRPVGRACPAQRPRTNAAVPISRFGSSVRDPRWPHPARREKR